MKRVGRYVNQAFPPQTTDKLQALLLAKQEESSVATHTRGLLFLGVPHGGTEAAFFASLLLCTAYWRGSSTTLLQYMAPGSDAIRNLESDFYNSYVLQRPHRRQILPRIVDFSEQRPERFGPFALGKASSSPFFNLCFS